MIAVIGCGNPSRTDDGAGVEVIRRLPRHPEVRLCDAGTDGMAVMFTARGCATLIVVDACRTGATPGAIFEAPGAALAAAPPAGHGLHDFRWDHALHVGRLMYGESFPTDVVVLLIEARSTDFGVGLSAEVDLAASVVAARIVELVRARCVRIRRGAVHFTAALHARHFEGLAGVILLRDGPRLLILPAQAGGYLIKVRNRAGDRLVDAADFFRGEGIADEAELERQAVWNEARAALVVEDVFAI